MSESLTQKVLKVINLENERLRSRNDLLLHQVIAARQCLRTIQSFVDTNSTLKVIDIQTGITELVQYGLKDSGGK